MLLLVGLTLVLFALLELVFFALPALTMALGLGGAGLYERYTSAFHPLLTGQPLAEEVGGQHSGDGWSAYDPWLGFRINHRNKIGIFAADTFGFIADGNPDRDLGTKAPGTFRIFILGGSTVAGHGATAPEQTISAHLQRMLREQEGREFQVINAGVPGYSSPHETAFLMNEIIYYQPDLVIVLDGYNDFFRMFSSPEQAERPGVYYHWNSYQHYLNAWVQEQHDNFSLPKRLRFWNYLYTVDFIARSIQVLAQAARLRSESDAAPGQSDSEGPPGYARQVVSEYLGNPFENALSDSDLNQLPGTADEMVLEHYVTYVSIMHAASEARGIQFAAVLQPMLTRQRKVIQTPAEVYFGTAHSQHVARTGHVNRERSLDSMCNEAGRRLSRSLNSAGQRRFYDFSTLFEGSPEELYSDWTHYNDRGNEVIAESLLPIALAAAR